MQKAAGQIAVPPSIISVLKKTCWQRAALTWMIFTSQSIPTEVRNSKDSVQVMFCVTPRGREQPSHLPFLFASNDINAFGIPKRKILYKITSCEWLWIFFAVCLYFGVVFVVVVAAVNLCASPFSWLPPLYSNRLSSTHSNADWRWRAKNPKAEIPGLDDGTGI